MDRGKRPSNFLNARNNKIYMDLKDIIREHALQYLPAKSLFRFQGVCRDWRLQIGTPFFAHNQSLAFHTVLGFFCQNPGDPPAFISIDPQSCGVPEPSLKFLPEPVDVRSSSGGLLCCQGRAGDRVYYICNPVTQQWKKLPKPNGNHGPNPPVVLVFEPSLLSFEADYKLVCAIPSVDFDDATEFEIYSSKEGSWRISGEIIFANKEVASRSGVYANGVVYWKMKRGGILAFDLARERSRILQSYYSGGGYLGTTDGKLCRVHVQNRSVLVKVLANVYSNTMQMNAKSDMWELKQKIDFDTGASFGDFGDDALIFFSSDTLVFRSGRKLLSYDMKTRGTTELSNLFEPGDIRWIPYVNSLVSV